MQNELIIGDIQQELNILRRRYSSLRHQNHKWRSFKHRVILPPPDPITIHFQQNKAMMIIIYDSHSRTIQGYQHSLLQKRLLLKRSSPLFRAILDFWNLINPFHFNSISRTIFLKVQEYIFIEILNRSQDRDLVRKSCLHDAELDFGLRTGVTFSEFYDSMFEIIDGVTNSRLVHEYVKFIKYIYDELKDSIWFSTQNLSSKFHLKDMIVAKNPAWITQILHESNAIPKQIEVENLSKSNFISKSFNTVKDSPSKGAETRHNRIVSDPSAGRVIRNRRKGHNRGESEQVTPIKSNNITKVCNI
jgi:hypothetical protein